MFQLLEKMFRSASVSKNIAKGHKARLAVENLEERCVPAVGISVAKVGVLPVQLAPPVDPTMVWIDQNIRDTTIHSLTRQLDADHQLSRNDMVNIFQTVANNLTTFHTGLTAMQLADFESLINNPSIVGMPDYVRNLANKVINYDQANVGYQGTSLENFESRLQPGNGGWMLTDLTNKWFLGMDHPQLPTNMTYSDGSTIHLHYQSAAGTLFGSGINYLDVVQGVSADCYLLAPLEETALQNPQIISNMFIDNGDNTYTVRFYNHGTPDYVTVDRSLPSDANGKFAFANMGANVNSTSNKLWVALTEKAYAQEDASGWNGRPAVQQSNSYSGLDFGWANLTLPQITGFSAINGPLTGTAQVAGFENDFLKGRLIVFCTATDIPSSYVVPNHVYAMIGYFGNDCFLLGNPWGTNSTYNGQGAGLVAMTLDQLRNAGFDSWAEVTFKISVVGQLPYQATMVSQGATVVAPPASAFLPHADFQITISQMGTPSQDQMAALTFVATNLVNDGSKIIAPETFVAARADKGGDKTVSPDAIEALFAVWGNV